MGAGKSTLARRLATEGAVRFTLDEWMLELFDLTPYDADYGHRASRCKEVIWRVAADVLDAGVDVVLDWSQWSRQLRSDWAERAASRGAEVVVHFVDTPLDEAVRRVVARNAARPAGVHRIDVEEMEQFAKQFFDPPTNEEGLTLVVHHEFSAPVPAPVRDA